MMTKNKQRGRSTVCRNPKIWHGMRSDVISIQPVGSSSRVEVIYDLVHPLNQLPVEILEPIYYDARRGRDALLNSFINNSEKIPRKSILALVAGGGDTESELRWGPLKSAEAVDAVRYVQFVCGAYVAIGLGHNLDKYDFQIAEVADLVAPTPSLLGVELASYFQLAFGDRKVFAKYLSAERARRGTLAENTLISDKFRQLEVQHEL